VLIPVRAFLLLGFRANLSMSGFLTFVFIIVFIGGLIVLLVRVASATPQEQRLAPRVLIVFIIILIVFILKEPSFN